MPGKAIISPDSDMFNEFEYIDQVITDFSQITLDQA